MKSWTSRRKSLLSGECARVDECARLLLDFIYSSHVRQLAPSSGKMTDQPRSGDGATNCCPAAFSQERSCKILPNPQSINSTNRRAATQPYIPVISPSPAAGGRNDSVHTQVFHHLAVMVPAVSYCQRRHSQSGDGALSKRTLDCLHHILFVNTRNGFVDVSERVIQIFQDF